MRIANVVGTVTLNRCLPSFHGANLKLVVPLTLEDLAAERPGGGETLVAWDEMGAGIGNRIALSEGPEAAQPFRPEIKPLDAYVAAVLDRLEIDQALAGQMIDRE